MRFRVIAGGSRYPIPMPRDSKAVSLHPLSPVDALAALLRVPPPPKTKKPATAKRRAKKRSARMSGD
jgi:hypothetical protein